MPAPGRRDYAAAFRNTSIPADEPLFILRGQDVAAAGAVRAWCAFARREGTPAATLELALQQADAMDAWSTKKPADGPELTETERLQLEYALRRRGWRWSIDAQPTEGEVLAYELGQAEVFRRARDAEAALEAETARRQAAEAKLQLVVGLLDRCDDGPLEAADQQTLDDTLAAARGPAERVDIVVRRMA